MKDIGSFLVYEYHFYELCDLEQASNMFKYYNYTNLNIYIKFRMNTRRDAAKMKLRHNGQEKFGYESVHLISWPN